MSLEIPFRIRPLNATSNLDERYGPHLSIDAALTATVGTRAKGLTVGVLNGSGQVDEYWFKNGITDADLILKSSGSSGGSYVFGNGVRELGGNVSLGGNVTSNIVTTLRSNDVNNLNYIFTDNFEDVTFQINADRLGSGTSKIDLQAKYDNYFQSNIAHHAVVTTPLRLSATTGLNIDGSLLELSFEYNQNGSVAAVIRDQINLRGLEYAGDYSANFNDNSLVTKKWVQSLIGNAYSLEAVTQIGNETSLNIIAPEAPTLGTHLTNKTYVDLINSNLQQWVLDQDYITSSDIPTPPIQDLEDVLTEGNETTLNIIAPAAPTADGHLTNKFYVDNLFDSIVIPDLTNYYTKTQTDDLVSSSIATAVNGLASEQWVLDQNYITLNDIPAATIPTLQQVTAQGNVTSNALQVTGTDDLSAISSAIIGYDTENNTANLGIFTNSQFGGLSIEASTQGVQAYRLNFELGNGTVAGYLEAKENGEVATFGGKVAGTAGTENNHFVTLSQLQDAVGEAGLQSVTLTGDVIGSTDPTGILASTIANGAVTFDKIQNIPSGSFIGRSVTGVGPATSLTTNEVKTILQINLVDNTSDLDKPISLATQAALDDKVDKSSVGQANGVASLDSGGKVPAVQLPNSVMTIEGEWDASTNTPTLQDGVGDAGQVYEVSVAGTQNLGSGNITFAVGDWVVYGANGTWYKSKNSNEVTRVNGLIGDVQLNLTFSGGNLNITGGGTAINLSSTYALSARTLTAGVGLSGGGNLTANRTISLGTPSSITPSSTNNASGTTHTHAISGFVSTTNDGGSAVANLTGLDANTITYTNMIYGGSWSNTPTSTGYLQTLRHPNPVETGSSAQIFWNQANNTFHWRTQTGGTYGSWLQAADRDWVLSQIPAVQTLSFSSVYDSTLAQLSISGGNSVLINSLRSATRQTHDQNITQSAFQPYTNSAGSTGYPSTTGSGIVLNRLSTATNNSGFNLWTSASSTDELRLAFISGNNVYSNWYTIATREWTNANLLQLGDAIQNVSGVKYFTNFYIGNSSTQNVSYGISALGVSGAYGDLVESDLLSDAKFSKSRTDYYTFAQANTVTFPNLQTKAISQGSAAFSYARFETKKVWTNGAGVQFAYPYGTTESVLNKIYFRASTAATSGVWTPWYTLATREYIQGGMGFGLSYNSTNDKFELGTPVDAGGGTIAHVVDYGTDWLGFGDVLGGSNSTLLFNSTQFNLVGGAQVGGVYSNITGSTTSLTMRFVSTGGTGRGIIIANGAAPALQGDYSSIYTDRSIVDKAYVDLQISNINVWSKQTSGFNTWYKFTDLSATGITGGLNSVYMGNKTSATTYTLGQESTTIGGESAAQGLRSVSIGYQNTVVAAASFGIALGSILTVSGINDVAIGQANTVNGGTSIGGSIAIGKSITVTGSSSYAFGNGLNVSDANMTVIGTYNDITGLVAGDFVIGCGISDVDRRNALKINTSRQATFYGRASYDADYSASFTARTLVDKGYVDGRNWYGTQAAYDAIATKDPNINYFIQA